MTYASSYKQRQLDFLWGAAIDSRYQHHMRRGDPATKLKFKGIEMFRDKRGRAAPRMPGQHMRMPVVRSRRHRRPADAAMRIDSRDGGLAVRVDENGLFEVATRDPAWQFSGKRMTTCASDLDPRSLLPMAVGTRVYPRPDGESITAGRLAAD
jgi:hypothetical protein